MAPIKFEENIKDKLNKRTIAPSDGAWDKLASRLDAENNRKDKSSYWWIGLAASVVGVLLVITQFSSNEIELTPQDIVNTPTTEEIIDTNIIDDVPIKEHLNPEVIIASESVDEEVSKTVVKENKVKVNLPNTNLPNNQIAQEQVVPIFKEDRDLIKPQLKVELNFEAEKVQQVADAIYDLNSGEAEVSSTDIDSLLKQAQREILLNRMQNEDKAVVDAALLLKEVEFELDESFRERVFKAFKSTYGSVKTAIAQRNK
ncbi:MAG: hypothetical protein ACON5F_14445 [Jejuia sp.]